MMRLLVIADRNKRHRRTSQVISSWNGQPAGTADEQGSTSSKPVSFQQLAVQATVSSSNDP